MKTILITGGLGFIGSHLTNALKENYTVTILDNKSNNKIDNTDCELIIDDIRTFKTERHFDYVIHLAAIASISSEFNPELYSVNCAGFENIYHNVKCGKFIYASSAAAINKANDYGKTKAHNEHIAKDGLGFRFFNVYGENDNGVVGKLFKPGAKIYGGLQTRDFIYVKDVVNFIIDNIDKKGVIEVGTGVETPLYMLAKMIDNKIEFVKGNTFEEQRSVCFNPIDKFTSLYDGLIKSFINYETQGR